jgi:hypothetical protein
VHRVYQYIAIFFLAVYPFGVPLIFLYLLWKNKHEFLDNQHPNYESSRQRFGFLVDDYSAECYYWV